MFLGVVSGCSSEEREEDDASHVKGGEERGDHE
jgi:hypothetical protein